MTRSEALNRYHETNSKTNWSSNSKSLMAMVIDDLRRSGPVPYPEHTSFSPAYTPTRPSILNLLNSLEDSVYTDPQVCSDESFTVGGDYPPSMLEPAPLNIPDSRTVAEASGLFYVVKEPASTAERTSSSFSWDMNKSSPCDDESMTDSVLTYNDATASVLDEKHTQDQSTKGRFRCYQSLMWNKRFNDLLEYQKRTGNCHVPLTYHEDPTLARWVKRQRYQYKAMKEGKFSTMTEERVKALEDIGFIWDSQGTVWRDRLRELIEFKHLHKHCNVPSNYSKNPSLAVWVKCQRRQYKLFKEGKPSTIVTQRIRDLERIGFQWLLRSYHCKKMHH